MSQKKVLETLRCPRCGEQNIQQAGIPFKEHEETKCYYQCQSDSHRKKEGCGYLALKESFIVPRRME